MGAIDKFADLKPIKGEERYADWDDEFQTWAVFGLDSGYCYGQYDSEEKAEDAVDKAAG